MNRMRILIVEDEGVLALALESMVNEFGYAALDPVASGEEAVTVAKNEQPDLVLMDIQLAGEMDGITAAGNIHSFSNIPVIYMTGHSDEGMLERAVLTSPYGYLIKPVSMYDLKVCLEMTLREHARNNKKQEIRNR